MDALHNRSSGQVVAYRTLLQPDPTRSYALAAVVAFNLKAVHLHYEVGFSDPYAPGVKKFSDGSILPIIACRMFCWRPLMVVLNLNMAPLAQFKMVKSLSHPGMALLQ